MRRVRKRRHYSGGFETTRNDVCRVPNERFDTESTGTDLRTNVGGLVRLSNRVLTYSPFDDIGGKMFPI